ncbi:MAG: AbrB/MazE/SpoVT family DNA-binding domain-containing protein [Phenylobacterium sp.]|jgi:AbrB family looped-hinge helix DNA binding protein|uniref:AbrB/MazE/SpoVT family DNA-binding domain-containing protein n=1 Tax=Phenylobacterium sp. TaxID=1871053 RepID=UPI00391A2F55
MTQLTTILSTKGQVILPKAVRDERKWRPGTRLTVENTDDGVMLRRVPLFPAAELDEAFGMLKAERTLSIEDMDAAVAAEAARRARD